MPRERTFKKRSEFDEDFLGLPRSRAAMHFKPPDLPKPKRVILDGRTLKFRFAAGPDEGSSVIDNAKIPSTLCFDFARLAGGSDEQIRRFAAAWGPLRPRGRYNKETLKLWRDYARLAQAALRLGSDEATTQEQIEDWEIACKYVGYPKFVIPDWKKLLAAAIVNQWFSKARNVSILFPESTKALRIELQAGSLFGILAIQLAYVIVRTSPTIICSGCRLPFKPDRRPSRGPRQYCGSCRKKKIPQRDAARDFRNRVRTSQPPTRNRR